MVSGRAGHGEDADEAGRDVLGGDLGAEFALARPALRMSSMAASSSAWVRTWAGWPTEPRRLDNNSPTYWTLA
jgi:hypothetical protein